MHVSLDSIVLPEEIDSLGHMNVRYYMARMEQANRALLQQLDVIEPAQPALLRRTDTYTRFRKEQFVDAALSTSAQLLDVGEGGMRSYVEISNATSGDVAATFIVTTALMDRDSRQHLPFQVHGELQQTGEVPAFAQPRSLNLSSVNTQVSLTELDACIPEVEGGGMMSGKRAATIEAEDVDAAGWLADEVELMFLPFAKMAKQNNAEQGPPVFHTADGKRVGWAVMETRTLLYGQPRLHDELAYFSADLRLEHKSRLSRRWCFNRVTEQLLGISDTVGVCIDLDARRAVAWPDELRQQIEAHQQPQLA